MTATLELHPQHLPDVHLQELLASRYTSVRRRFAAHIELSYRFGTSHKSLRRFDTRATPHTDDDTSPDALIARYDAYRASYWSLMQRAHAEQLKYTRRTPLSFASTMVIEGHPEEYRPYRLTPDHRIIFRRPPSGFIYGSAHYQLPLFGSWQ